MDAHVRKLAGWVIAALGAIIVIVGALADALGLGEDDGANFGSRQVAAVVVGLVVVGVGLALARWRFGSGEPTTASPSES